LKRILIDGGYIEGGVYYFYLTDHLGNNRVVANSSGAMIQKTHYYPFGMAFAESTDQGKQPYKYNGKEFDQMHGLNLYDYSARYMEPALGRFTTVDPLAEKYYSVSPYVYCANSPINAIDPEGKLVIFVNGFHWGDGGDRDYWDKNGGGFATAVERHLGEYNSIFYDGSVGYGVSVNNLLGFRQIDLETAVLEKHSLSSDYRYSAGYEQGIKDFDRIKNTLKKDETIKIIAHSMGAAYAKGFVQALLNSKIDPSIIEFEADFAPFQPTKQTAVKNVDTYQFSHNKDYIAGNKNIKGAKMIDTSSDENQGHSISSFLQQIMNLPQGSYKIEENQIIHN